MATNAASVLTDDPGTSAPADPTITPVRHLQGPQVVEVPTLGQLGMLRPRFGSRRDRLPADTQETRRHRLDVPRPPTIENRAGRRSSRWLPAFSTWRSGMPVCLVSFLLAAAMASAAIDPNRLEPPATAGSPVALAPEVGAGTSHSASPIVTFSTPGLKTVTLQSCNSGGCSTVTKTITVLNPAPRIGAISGPSTVGSAESVVAYSAAAAGRPPLAYNWRLTRPDGFVATGELAILPLGSGEHRRAPARSHGLESLGLPEARAFRSLWCPRSSPISHLPFSQRRSSRPCTSPASRAAARSTTPGLGSSVRETRSAGPSLAVFLGRGLHPPPYAPPPATGTFGDVPPGYWAGAWIEQVFRDGLTGGCATGGVPLFCPASLATRAEIAVLFVRAIHGAGFVPPAPTGIFGDVPAGYWAAPWVEQLYRDGVTAGCQGAPSPLFCPGATTTRAEVAVFLVRAFHLAESPTPLAFQARLCGSPASCSYPAGLPIEFLVQVGGGIPTSYDYDWDGNGSYEESVPFPVPHIFNAPGLYTPKLRLRLGASSAVISHPFAIRINPAVTSSPLPPTVLSAAAAGLRPPAATDPPGTLIRAAYTVSAVDPPGILGYAAYVGESGAYRFAGLLSPRNPTASDSLLLPQAPLGTARYLSLRAFTATGFGPSSLTVRLP